MYRQFICIAHAGNYDDTFTVLSGNIEDVVKSIRENFIEFHFNDDEINELLKNNEKYYATILSGNEFIEPMINVKVYDTIGMNNDIEAMDKVLNEINSRDGESYYTLDVSMQVNKLITGISYRILYTTNGIIIRRYEETYCGSDSIYSMRRELSDYNKNGNMFSLNDKVRIKGFDGEYTISAAPNHVFNDQWWENIYSICVNTDGPEIDIHESELEVVEEINNE